LRIAYLIAEKGVPPYNILAVTFTNKAAGEMRERVKGFLQGQQLQSAPLISTFHSLCVRILRQDIEHLSEGYTKSFTIYDTSDSQKLSKPASKTSEWTKNSCRRARFIRRFQPPKIAAKTLSCMPLTSNTRMSAKRQSPAFSKCMKIA
jgi:DNA helicase-2/ATP-dependent DNA helicase PcrA